MPEIEVGDEAVQIDAKVLAEALRIDTDELLRRMREGTVTSRLERGEDEDAGRVRLTFYSASRRVRVVADANGKILSCGAVDYGERPLPAALRDAGRRDTGSKAG